MDLEKIQVRQDLERMVINYFLMGKISEEQSRSITSHLNVVIGDGRFPKPEAKGNIIYFPGAWQEKPSEPPKAPEIRRKIPNDPVSLPPFEAHCEGFKGVDFGSAHARILWALYYLRIHSLEELAGTPASKLKLRHRIGRKSLELIQAALESRGFTLPVGKAPETKRGDDRGGN
jgi:hypothetical protein